MNESTSLGNNAAMTDAGQILGDSVEKDVSVDHPSSADSQAEMLVKALRNVIVPFIQPANRTAVDDTLPIGPEGEEFLLALKKFVMSIIQSQSDRKAEITVNLKEWSTIGSSVEVGALIQDKLGHGLKDGDKGQLTTEQQTEDNNSSDIPGLGGKEVPDGPEPPLQLTPLEKVREALRQHVFNNMPIRMLSFNAEDAEFTITLVEREMYFGYFLSKIETGFDEAEFLMECNMRKRVYPYADVEHEVINGWVARVARYAVLSQAWDYDAWGEVRYYDVDKQNRVPALNDLARGHRPGVEKLNNFCRVAAMDYGVTLGWVDVVCIDERNSAELDEVIQYMYTWYQNATISITYLAKAINLENMCKECVWFTPALRKLLGPKCTKLYAKDWTLLGEVSLLELGGGDDREGSAPIQKELGLKFKVRNKRQPTVRGVTNSDGEEISDGPEHPLRLTPLEKVQDALHQHIFNAMPIRMLFFNTLGTKFTVTLVERGWYSAYLLRKLKAGFDEGQFLTRCEAMMFRQRDDCTYKDVEHAVIKEWIARFARYAILSHTWLPGALDEVTYSEWYKGGLDIRGPGYRKLVSFCKVAVADHGVTLVWMDTVCINKDSSAELDESIRSMYKWYKNAYICITYLAETDDLAAMHKDPWFTRGWTLQELLAPQRIKFYSRDWNQLTQACFNDKDNGNIQEQIEKATTIDKYELNNGGSRISRQMQWAAVRQVTCEEDAAYSIMGLFNVNMSIAYGEGAQQAFSRLLKEILNSSRRDNSLELFYWAGNEKGPMSALLPSSPKAYLAGSHQDLHHLSRMWTPIAPLTITHLGVTIPILLMPVGILYSTDTALYEYRPAGDYYSITPVTLLWFKPGHSTTSATFTLLDLHNVSETVIRLPHYDNFMHHFARLRCAIGVLNVERGSQDEIYIPGKCFGVVLQYREEWVTSKDEMDFQNARIGVKMRMESIKKVATKEPVVFDLNCRKRLDEDLSLARKPNYLVKEYQLAQHGMKLLNLHL